MTDNLRCPECSGGNLSGKGRMNSAGEWETDWTCDGPRGCQHQFGTIEVEADDGSLAARRLKKRPWLRRLRGQR